ncbi:glycosyltransferase [Sphingobacterium sp. SGG-5]|uniref:glycosyltransferase n=1 Tax=Sphingobacterium sp. SGG-5 TaxID=2710881 RepID=UPI0013EB57B6|nr:glycosyltransferase [Sphingobacterium sp. SGG-5]NGM63424.1 glycosyltransferase [Sphingobacterium sp. SGG-5]
MKIKILHIQETISSGGVERTRLSLARLLDKDRFQQKIICTNASGNLVDKIRNEGADVIPIGILKHPFQWSQHKKVQKIIEAYKPDIVHGAVFEGVTMAAINGWLKRVPYIIIEETSDPKNRSWKGHMLMRFFSKTANKVIGVSESVTEEYLKGKLRLSASKVITINNGVALPREVSANETQEAQIKFGFTLNDFVIGSTGRMLQDSHKRFSDLIKAFARFAENKSNVKLLLVGDGPERIRYEKLTHELDISDKVVFVGYQSDTTLFYQMMHVFALVSAREAFGLVLAEAMLNKLPVLATRVGGMKYIVDDQETGFLVEPKDVSAIAEKLEILYQDAELKKQMGETGYNKALQEYTEDKYAEKISDLYLSFFKPKSI